ncbi:MAG: hypothetical protein FJ264_02505 [Planctomycetes bacterium]|nr:hypothetical protein [Planctomycetota bacterium]
MKQDGLQIEVVNKLIQPMPKITIEYCKERVIIPLSYWVHKAVDAAVWHNATRYEPSMPVPVVDKDYSKYQIKLIEIDCYIF